MLYHGPLDVFQCLEDASPLIQEVSSVLTHWREVAGFYTLSGSVLIESFRTRVSSELQSG